MPVPCEIQSCRGAHQLVEAARCVPDSFWVYQGALDQLNRLVSVGLQSATTLEDILSFANYADHSVENIELFELKALSLLLPQLVDCNDLGSLKKFAQDKRLGRETIHKHIISRWHRVFIQTAKKARDFSDLHNLYPYCPVRVANNNWINREIDQFMRRLADATLAKVDTLTDPADFEDLRSFCLKALSREEFRIFEQKATAAQERAIRQVKTLKQAVALFKFCYNDMYERLVRKITRLARKEANEATDFKELEEIRGVIPAGLPAREILRKRIVAQKLIAIQKARTINGLDAIGDSCLCKQGRALWQEKCQDILLAEVAIAKSFDDLHLILSHKACSKKVLAAVIQKAREFV